MDEITDMDVSTITHLECVVCGERNYELRAGYYYCVECGTIAQNFQLIEVEHVDDFDAGRFARTKKFKMVKQEELEITSWECYNYILRGLVNDLINLGAKEELQMVTLQLWAAYLRRMQVAFFNKREADLPHLGVRYQDKDAELVYNYKKLTKKRDRRPTMDSNTSAESNARSFRKSVRKLDESIYSLNSQSEAENSSFHSSGQSSSTGRTSRAIRLEFSNAAKKIYKKKMSKAHLKMHASDVEGSLKCHSTKIKASEMKRSVAQIQTLNIKQLYSILGIALNLIEDDIQLCDFVRYIAEDHISVNNVANYFPENLQTNIDKILNSIAFYTWPSKFSYQFLRDHINELAKFLNVHEFKMPNILSLTERYVTELHLPKYLTVIIHRLINLLPPSQCTRRKNMYGAFEARAMAYIIFVLKLLFGLDGEKEQRISKSAQKINKHLVSLSSDPNVHSQLFVWSEWVQYIEMRKIILSQNNHQFSKQFEQGQNTADFIKEMQTKQKVEDDEEFLVHNVSLKYTNYRSIAECLAQKYEKSSRKSYTSPPVPSLTPAHIQFKRILTNSNETLPKYMYKDHTETAMEPYLCHKELSDCLSKHNVRLCVKELNCNERRNFIGIFHVPFKYIGVKAKKLNVYKADFSINEEDWRAQIAKTCDMFDGLEYKTEFTTYHRSYLSKLKKRYRNLEMTANDDYHDDDDDQADCTLKTASSDIFNDDDMTPYPSNELSKPRTNLESIDIFDSNDYNESDADQSNVQDDCTSLTLHQSTMDYWQVLGFTTLITEIQKKELSAKFPLSFFWLLETCAQTIGVDWVVVYEQLLVLEVMFGLGLKNLKNFTDCLHYRYHLKVKDFNALVMQYRKIW